MRERAPFGKVMGAFLVASIAAGLVGGVISGFLFSGSVLAGLSAIPVPLVYALIFGFPLAFGHALLLGLPAYLWFERRYALTWGRATGAGALVGILPMLLWNAPAAAWGGFFVLLVPGVSGAAGGLVFRAALHDLMRNP